MEIDGKEKMQKAEAVKVDEFQHLDQPCKRTAQKRGDEESAGRVECGDECQG